MNDDDRRRYHLKANDIAEQARRDIEEKLIQSDRVIPAPRPKEGNTPPSLSKEETALKERLLNEANEIKEKAKAEIKRDVLDKLPARATDHDRWLIRRDAHNILDNDYPQYKELTLKDRQISPEFNDMAAQKEREGEVPGRGQERMPQPPSQAEPPQPAKTSASTAAVRPMKPLPPRANLGRVRSPASPAVLGRTLRPARGSKGCAAAGFGIRVAPWHV